MKNVFDLLKEDHQNISELMSQLEDISGQRRRKIYSQLMDELVRHMALEEDLLYPALEDDDETRDMVREFYDDHHTMRNQLQKLVTVFVDGGDFDERLEALMESFDSHIQEEEGSLFRKASRLLAKKKLDELSGRIASERKKAA